MQDIETRRWFLVSDPSNYQQCQIISAFTIKHIVSDYWNEISTEIFGSSNSIWAMLVDDVSNLYKVLTFLHGLNL